MEKEKDNGYVEKQDTEAGAEAQGRVGGEKDCSNQASTGLGKFKDVDALLKAYDCLQAEFTRRSQRLKSLEKEWENSQSKSGASGVAEKLRKNAEKVKSEEEKFDGFIAEIEGANVRALANEDLTVGEPYSFKTKGTERSTTEIKTGAETNVEAVVKTDDRTKNVMHSSMDGAVDSVESGAERKGVAQAIVGEETFVAESRKERLPSSDELYRLASGNEEVRLKIIGEYLHSVGKSGAPLVKGGNGLLSTPPMRAKTVKEAGEMALRWFQREGAK